jgi:hypothetical protein
MKIYSLTALQKNGLVFYVKNIVFVRHTYVKR